MIEARSAATALNKHKGLQQFFKLLLAEKEISGSPMERVRQPKTPQKPIPIIHDDDTRKLLEARKGKGKGKGKGFANLCVEAIIRLSAIPGGRLSEVGNLHVDDVDLPTESVRCTTTARGQGPAGTGRSEDRPGAEPVRARPRQAHRRQPAASVARRLRRPHAQLGLGEGVLQLAMRHGVEPSDLAYLQLTVNHGRHSVWTSIAAGTTRRCRCSRRLIRGVPGG